MDFSQTAPAEEIAGVMRAAGQIALDLGLEENGYRLITNAGLHSGQEVPHFHIHLLGGKALPAFPA